MFERVISARLSAEMAAPRGLEGSSGFSQNAWDASTILTKLSRFPRAVPPRTVCHKRADEIRIRACGAKQIWTVKGLNARTDLMSGKLVEGHSHHLLPPVDDRVSCDRSIHCY